MNLLDYILGKRYVESQISQIKPEEKTVTPTKSQQIVTPTTGKYLSKVTVNTIPSSYIIPSGTVEITENGTHDVTEYANVNVNVITESSIVEVETLPTENIDSSKIYSSSTPINTNVYYVEDVGGEYIASSLKDIILNIVGVSSNILYYVVDGLPSSPNITDLQTFQNIYVYIYNNIPYVYGNIGSGNTWITCSMLFAQFGENATDKGYIKNIESAPESGLYVSYEYDIYAFPNNNKSIYMLDDNNVWLNYERMAYELLSKNMETFYFPSGIRAIPRFAFYECTNLKTLQNTNNIIYIAYHSFTSCTSLTSISFPSVTTIGSYSFSTCRSLTSVNIPNATSIGTGAFDYCYSLTKLVIRQTDIVCTLDNDVFDACYHFLGTFDSKYNPEGLKDGRIYVPDSLVDSYKEATNWSAFADIIVPLSTLVE